MKVSQILQRKAMHKVASISPDETVAHAVAELSRLRIGALIVMRGAGEIAGILSERDIVASLGAEGPSALSKHVGALMTSSVETCGTEDTAHYVLGRMTQGRFRHMPVVEAGRMIGIVSIGDVVKARLDEIQAENAAMADMLSH